MRPTTAKSISLRCLIRLWRKPSKPTLLSPSMMVQKLQVTILEKNSGHRAAFSKALELAQPQLSDNDLIALADQDDIWLPQKLELLEKEIQDKALVFGDAQVVDADRKIMAESWRSYSKIEKKISMEQQIAGINNVTGCLSLFRAALLKTILPIPEGVTVHDRWIAMIADRQGGIAAIDTPVVQYRIHGNNAVGGVAAPSMSKTLETQIQWIQTILDNAGKLLLTKKEIRFAKKLLGLAKARLTCAISPLRLRSRKSTTKTNISCFRHTQLITRLQTRISNFAPIPENSHFKRKFRAFSGSN